MEKIFSINELYFIKCSKNDIEEKCKKAIQQKVVDMSYMFSNFEYLTKLDLSIFDTENVIDMSNMFSSCYNLKEINLSSLYKKIF